MALWQDKEDAGSEPLELVTFSQGGLAWRYTSGRVTLTVSGIDYLPGILDRGNIQHSEEEGAAVALTLDVALPIVAQFQGRPSTVPIFVSIRKYHAGATDQATRPLFQGFVQSAVLKGGTVEVTLATHRNAAALGQMPRISFGRDCPLVVYDSVCLADPTASVDGVSHTQDATVGVISGETLTLTGTLITAIGTWIAARPSFRDAYSWIVGGIVNCPDGTALFVWGAENYIAGTSIDVSVIGPVPGSLSVSDTVSCLQACRNTAWACGFDFDNSRHFKGFPFIPAKDPFREGFV